MIPRPKPERFRLRRTMMFMNAQKPGLIKDAYIYGCDSIMLDLEDAVAENQKDAARFSLYHALKTIDYGDTEVIVRINGLDTPHWQEDIRVCVAGGADGIRIAKCESAQDVKTVEAAVEAGGNVCRPVRHADGRRARMRAKPVRHLAQETFCGCRRQVAARLVKEQETRPFRQGRHELLLRRLAQIGLAFRRALMQ